MKLNKFLFFMAAILVGLFAVNSNPTISDETSDLVKENLEAIAVIEQVGDRWFNAYDVPCAGSAQEIRIDCSYINCAGCRKEKGKADDTLIGNCTFIEPID